MPHDSRHSAKMDAKKTNVISLARMRAPEKPRAYPACRDLLGYWHALRAARQMPARCDFDPRGIEQTLNCSFIAEKVAPRVARIRVAGSLVNDVLGMDVRGMPVSALFDPDSREAAGDILKELFEAPAQARLELSTRRFLARKPIHAQMVLLPLSDGAGGVTRLVGCLDTGDDILKTPRRFSLVSSVATALEGLRPQPNGPFVPFQSTRQTNPSFAFAEAASIYEAQRSKPSALRLVIDNS